MSPRVGRGRLVALLRLVAISAVSVTCTRGQVTSFGGCPNYQVAADVTKTYDQTMIDETATGGYKILMTTDRPKTEGCYVFKFEADKTFSLDYSDSNYNPVMHKGRFEFNPKTYTDSGSVYLGLPASVLGGGLFGGSRLYIIYVESTHFVAISCRSSGILKTEHVHVFAKEASMAALVPAISTVNSTLESKDIPYATMFREVDQTCTKPAPEPPSGLLLSLMTKLGTTCPSAKEIIGEYRSALESSARSTQPKHLYTSNFDTPVEDETYLKIQNPSPPLPTHQFSSHDGSPAQAASNQENVNPAWPLTTHQFTPNFGAAVPAWTYPKYVNPASPTPTHQFSSHNGVLDPVGTYSSIRHPVSAAGSGQMQPYYFYDPARPEVGFSPQGVFRPPYSGFQTS